MRQLLSVEFEKKQICQLATWRIWRLQGLAEPLSWVEGLAQGQIHADNLGNIRDRGALRGAGDLLDALRGPPARLVIAPSLAFSFPPSQYATASRRTNLHRRRRRPEEDASHFPVQKMV